MPTPDPLADLRPFLPRLREWIGQTLAAHASAARSPASVGFTRLPLYFPGEAGEQLLNESRFVQVETLPKPPLAEWGLKEFRWYEEMGSTGVTYQSTYFLTPETAREEFQHLHELVHVGVVEHPRVR